MPCPTRLIRYGVLLVVVCLPLTGAAQSTSTAMVMIGQPQLRPNTPPAYSNPHAPNGGTLRLAELGSFDTLNPFSVRGNVPHAIRTYVFESLMLRHYDEPFALYGLLASHVVREDATRLRFVLNPRARFSDGKPVRAQDVAFSWEVLRTKGRPNHRNYYNKVARVDVLNAHEIRFHLADTTDRELPLILGLMPILPEHIYRTRDIRTPGLQIPIGSGPYIVANIAPGRRLHLHKNPDYWGASLPLQRGRYNFDRLQYTYFRDAHSAFQAFTRGLVDIWFETDAHRWASGYDIPAIRDGRMRQKSIALGLPSGLKGFVFNTRRAVFAHKSTRQGLSLLLDRARLNTMLYANTNALTHSYFGGTALSAWQQDIEPAERAILGDAPLSPEARKGQFAPDIQDIRTRRRRALGLLAQAGWRPDAQGQLRHAQNDTPLRFEILVHRQADERIALVYAAALKRVGILAQIRLVDEVQYQNRLRQFDYDMIVYHWFASLSPGNEQTIYWGSQAANTPGARNYAGIRSAAMDRAIGALLGAKTQSAFTAAARALDRSLMDGQYVIPLFHRPAQWVAWWHTHIRAPQAHSLYGVQLAYWWAAP